MNLSGNKPAFTNISEVENDLYADPALTKERLSGLRELGLTGDINQETYRLILRRALDRGCLDSAMAARTATCRTRNVLYPPRKGSRGS